MSNSSDGITQSNSGSMSGGMQAAIGNNNTQSMRITHSSQDDNLNKEDILEILTQVSKMLSEAELSASEKSSIVKYISKVSAEIQEEAESDKDVIAAHLKRATENLAKIDQTLESSKSITDKVIPLLGSVWKWAGIVASYPVF